MTAAFRPALAVLTALLLAGCLSPNPPLRVRWFAPEVPPPETVSSEESEAPALLFDRVTPSPHLDQRMVWRVSEVELAFDESNRWIVSPEITATEALSAALFGSGRFDPAPNAESPVLDVRLTAFEAVRSGSPHVRVELVAEHRQSFAGPTRHATFDARETLEEASPEAFARAAGRALGRAAADLATWASAGD